MPPSPDSPDIVFAPVLDELRGAVSRALEQLPLPIWLCDRRGVVRWSNLAANGLLGEMKGLHFSRFIAPERVNEGRELFARKILGSTDATVQATTLLGSAGRVDTEMTSVPLRFSTSVVGVMSVSRLTSERTSEQRPRPILTPRQHQVLEQLAHGQSTARIAAELQIAEETARNHIRLLLSSLGVHSRVEAVAVAFRNGWL
jgi:DNA-binding CsgD family transcriptional regulator